MTRDTLIQLGLGHVTHTRVHRTGPRPGITTDETQNQSQDTVSKFYPPDNVPSEYEIRKMFSVALEHLIKQAMGNHVYSFNGFLRKQSAGAAIGTTLAGALAALYMIRWSKDFKHKVEYATTEIEGFTLLMLKIYVDDANIISTPFPLGSRLDSDGEIRIHQDEIENDRNVPSDSRTAKLFGEIGNTVCDFLKLTTDCPSNHSSGFMPLLDIQVKVEQNQVIYKFYSKPMASPFLMLANSAMPDQMKRNGIVQEALRRLRNTKRDLPWNLKAHILSEFSYKMMVSGYSEKFRLEIIQSAVRGYEKQCEAADQGLRPLHRTRDFQAVERWKKKSLSKTSWYRPNDSVGFVPATPGGVLARTIQAIVKEETARIGLSVRIVEQGGISMKQ